MPVIFRPFALMVLPLFLVIACAAQPRYDSSGAYQAYCKACGTIEHIAKVRVHGGVPGRRIQESRGEVERGYRFEVQFEDGCRAQVTQPERHGLRVGDSIMIRDEQVRLRR